MSDLLTEALSRLPHGPEFRFVDRLISLTPGQAGVGEYIVRGDESFLRAHFPGQPIFPGVLLAEAGAQLAGVVAQCDPAVPPLAQLRLTALRGVKILGAAKPGDVITLEARISARMANLIQAEARALVGGQLLMQAEVTLSGTSGQQAS